MKWLEAIAKLFGAQNRPFESGRAPTSSPTLWVGPRRWVWESFAFPPQPGLKSSIFRCRGVLQLPLICTLLLLGITSCSPLKSSPNDEKHQLELTLHEVQTNLDDLRHDINCFQTELQILDGRIKYSENTLATLKQNDLEKQQAKIDQLTGQVQALEKKWLTLDKSQKGNGEELSKLSDYANETTAALAQYKARIGELEQEIFSQNRKFDEIAKLKGHIEILAKGQMGDAKLYRVKAGDSLEKIAKAHKTSVEKIKKINHLDQDLIVVGQELKIPTD